MDNAVSGRSASRSVPDSGIDPDDVSITSSVTEYLSQIGIKENKQASSSSLSRCSDESIRMRQKISMDNAVSGRSASRSVPDSGIDPDDVSITSSVTEYLSQIGIKENKMLEQQKGEDANEKLLLKHNGLRCDPDLNELIYAKVDEILSPTGHLNASFQSNPSFSIPSLNVFSTAFAFRIDHHISSHLEMAAAHVRLKKIIAQHLALLRTNVDVSIEVKTVPVATEEEEEEERV
uniref:Phosphoprotein n=1 Tax=Ascaris lumbricoides TaxID=6252 RepID=A0A0M3ITX1_ASCLU